MTYYLAPALAALRDEVNKRYPKRDHASDGWVGDTSHQARPSDHNPDWSAGGVVRAIDIDIAPDGDPNTDLAQLLVQSLIGDPRVWYVIHQFPGKEPTIWSRTYNWQPRRYTGTNPHNKHVHVSIQGANGISVLAAKRIEQDTSVWLDPVKRRVRPLAISLSEVRDQFGRALGLRHGAVTVSAHVRRVQRALNTRYPDRKVSADGLVGRATLDLWGYHERHADGTGRPRVPDERSLAALVRPRFRMVD